MRYALVKFTTSTSTHTHIHMHRKIVAQTLVYNIYVCEFVHMHMHMLSIAIVTSHVLLQLLSEQLIM